MAIDKSSFEQHLEKLKGEYAAQLPAKLDAIVNDWQALCHQWNPELMVRLHRNVHSLIGTSGTFGFTDLSKAARSLEVLLKPIAAIKENTYLPDQNLIAQVNKKCQELQSLLTPGVTEPAIPATNPTSTTAQELARLSQEFSDSRQSGIVAEDVVIYYLDDEIAAPEMLVHSLISYGFKSKHFRTMGDLLAAVHQAPPDLVILDLVMPDIPKQKVFSLAQSIVNMGIKVFVLSGQDNFMNRLESVRAGIHAFILKPADIPSLISLIRNILKLNSNKPAHILIIDDQEAAANFYSKILQQAGMNVTIESNPLNVLPLIASTCPDLLLLDLHMPEVNGDELAAVIRQHEKYQSIPILFLSAETHPDIKTQLLEIGSDDFLSKGMEPVELVRQIKSRLERSKILTAMMYQDSLTGLLNHAQIQLAAERSFQQSKRKHSNFCVAMIDIDNFKQVNDNYGHMTGDRVIKALAQLLQQRLRTTDYIGRFGGEEFMLVLPNTGIQEAAQLINHLRRVFHEIQFKEGEQILQVSFSAGVAENTGKHSIISLVKDADEALYRAKNRGRNLVCTCPIAEA